MNKEQTFYLFDHNENEPFQIIGVENLIAWLNDNDDNFSFSTKEFDFEPRQAWYVVSHLHNLYGRNWVASL